MRNNFSIAVCLDSLTTTLRFSDLFSSTGTLTRCVSGTLLSLGEQVGVARGLGGAGIDGTLGFTGLAHRVAVIPNCVGAASVDGTQFSLKLKAALLTCGQVLDRDTCVTELGFHVRQSGALLAQSCLGFLDGQGVANERVLLGLGDLLGLVNFLLVFVVALRGLGHTLVSLAHPLGELLERLDGAGLPSQ